MNILLFSCHEILEANLINLFLGLGHNVFSMGAFHSNSRGTGIRPEIPNFNPDPRLATVYLTGSKDNVPQELIEWSHCIVMMHNAPSESHPQPWLANNWNKFKKAKKPVIWYSIGQSTGYVEESLHKFRKEGLKIVRYSPKETNIPNFAGVDATIRFSIDPADFELYEGNIARIVNVSQAMFGGGTVPSRGDHMNLKEFKGVVEGFDWKVFGPNNENATEHDGGILSYEDLKSMLKFNRVYMYVGTRPASYTLGGMEAMCAGIPIVSIGPSLGDSIYKDQKTFEMHELIGESGKAGFWSDNIDDLRKYCKMLVEDAELAKEVGAAGRLKAIQYFGKDLISKQWMDFFLQL